MPFIIHLTHASSYIFLITFPYYSDYLLVTNGSAVEYKLRPICPMISSKVAALHIRNPIAERIKR